MKLTEAKKGQLVRFNKKSDVYKVIETGYFTTLQNMYTNKISDFKSFTNKNGKQHDRTVEIVKFY